MNKLKYCLLSILFLGVLSLANAHINPNKPTHVTPDEGQTLEASLRADCAQSTAQVDQAINNVRARLLTGGDVWWDGDGEGRYVVPKVDPLSGLLEVSSIFAGAVWLGGFDQGDNLKVAAQTYGSNSSATDFWPGPLTDIGTVEPDTCLRWDRFFSVLGKDIDEHLRNWEAAKRDDIDYDPELIPLSIRQWPARGNEFFFDAINVDNNGWELPKDDQGLGSFFDQNGDGNYEPDLGDYPIIEIRECTDWALGDTPVYPDEMFFWIYNDNGGIHTESTNSTPIRMEVQVQAFGFATNDEINNMTFQRYKLINRAVEDITQCYFAMWVDADLGCAFDDYVGCDTIRDLAYIYNQDAQDGQDGVNCDGTPTYGTEIPIIGIDYFRGPLDEFGEELGMSSFTYYNNGSQDPPPGTDDPGNANEFYRYLSGSWVDGTPFTFGGDGHDPAAPESQNTNYAFPSPPDEAGGWSMCEENLGVGDRRTIQASGPFTLTPGAVNELIIGAVWVPNLSYPCPDISALLSADDLAQALFNNCFKITDGPDAPDVCVIELDQEVVLLLSNDSITSNNAFERYEERGLEIPEGIIDSVYRFEGYKVYQLASANVSVADVDDVEKVRLVYQFDIKNNVSKLFNWNKTSNPNITLGDIWTPEEMVNGADEGIQHSFSIKEDQFASGNRRLINHKEYYFVAIAYSHNNYLQYNTSNGQGQRKTYLEGRKNIGDGDTNYYIAIPHKPANEILHAGFGDGVPITRIDGVGVGGNYLDISDETRANILDESFDGTILYKPGAGPIDVKIYNPIDVQDGRFELTFVDENLGNDFLDTITTVGWELTDLDNDRVYKSDTTIDKINEQLIADFGFSISINQTADIGDKADEKNGAIDAQLIYKDITKPQWYGAVTDGQFPGTDFVKTGPGQTDAGLDPFQNLSRIGLGYFVPYYLTDWKEIEPNLSPAWNNTNSAIVRIQTSLQATNNVDIVFTSNRDLWSKCVVVETATKHYYGVNLGKPTEGDVRNFELRAHNSLKKDPASDGSPQYDDSEMGMSYFPGYAIDVETGERVNIFFGENSAYDGTDLLGDDNTNLYDDGKIITRDMIWNPSSQGQIFSTLQSFYDAYGAGQHYIYVTRQKYDECKAIRTALTEPDDFAKTAGLNIITWTSFPVLPLGEELLSYKDGLIPNELTVQLRVDNPYQVSEGTGDKNGYPTYQFDIEGYQATDIATDEEKDEALDAIGVVPNPYYGYSSYETSQFSTVVKVTNLPAKCNVTIYTLDGKFIRQYKRNEERGSTSGSNAPKAFHQIAPDVEWDLKNAKGIPIASGTYLIHIDAEGLGERVIKWFGVIRQFDASGL